MKHLTDITIDEQAKELSIYETSSGIVADIKDADGNLLSGNIIETECLKEWKKDRQKVYDQQRKLLNRIKTARAQINQLKYCSDGNEIYLKDFIETQNKWIELHLKDIEGLCYGL